MRCQSPSPWSPSGDVPETRPTAATLAEAAQPGADDPTGERAATRSLRGQIARLERELVEQRCSKWPRAIPDLAGRSGDPAPVSPDPAPVSPDPAPVSPAPAPVSPDPAPVSPEPAPAGPAPAGRRGAQLLGIGELEALRDDLVATLSAERRVLAARTWAEDESRRLREELLLDPPAYAGARVRSADVGEGGCGAVRSEPAYGVLGMVMGWWRVVVSSGCP